MNRFLFLLAATFLISFSLKASDAEVLFVDQSQANGSGNVAAIFNLTVPPTSGEEGEYEILSCVTLDDGTNFFINATPNWIDLNLGGECGDGNSCILGIWNKFSPEPNNVSSVCNWNVGTVVASGAVLRYSGVNPNSPVFASDCNSGNEGTAIAPSVNTPAGSMVVRIFGANDITMDSFNELPGSIEFGKRALGIGGQNGTSGLFMYGEPFENGGTTEEVSIEYNSPEAAWRACTIAIRMEGGDNFTSVPTLSQWGLISLAGILGIVGFMVIRRRKATA